MKKTKTFFSIYIFTLYVEYERGYFRYNITLFGCASQEQLIMDSSQKPLGIENRSNTITFHLTLSISS